MRAYWIMLIPLLAGACASNPRTAKVPAREPNLTPAISAREDTRLVETRYELRDYRDAADPSVRHEGHAVYRSTRVPVRAGASNEALAILPRHTYPPATHAPLPQTTEAAAELATQKQITAELRAIQTAMNATQKDAERKYDELVGQTAETIKLRRELEAERARVRQLESSLRERNNESTLPTSAPVAADMKW